MPSQQAPFRSPYRANRVGHVTFAFGAEAGNAIAATIQLQDERRRDLAVRAGVTFYLSDDANGDTMTGTAASGITAGTDGHFTSLVTGKMGFAVSEADGDIDLSISYTVGAKTWYLVAVLPDGGLVVSSAIVFA